MLIFFQQSKKGKYPVAYTRRATHCSCVKRHELAIVGKSSSNLRPIYRTASWVCGASSAVHPSLCSHVPTPALNLESAGTPCGRVVLASCWSSTPLLWKHQCHTRITLGLLHFFEINDFSQTKLVGPVLFSKDKGLTEIAAVNNCHAKDNFPAPKEPRWNRAYAATTIRPTFKH